jgi:hypothetical protein
MSRNGTGTYTLPAGNPVVTGTTISSTWANNTLNDIATALTQSLAKDGQTTPTANIPMGSFKLTGLGAPTTAGDALAYGSPMGAISGTTGTFSGAVSGTTGTFSGALTGSSLALSGNAQTASVTATQAAGAITLDCNLSNVFATTLTASITTPTYSNPHDGQTINWFITQGGAGSFTIAWGAVTAVKWPGGTAGVLSTAVGAVDLAVLTYRSSTGFWYATLAKGFA